MHLKKGQVMSLDLLFSMIITTLAIGAAVQLLEQKSYMLKEQQLSAQVIQLAELGANNLAANPEIVCELVKENGTHIAYLNNCIPQKGNEKISKTQLGIPQEFECLIQDGTSNYLKMDPASKGGCRYNESDPENTILKNPANPQVYSIKRIIVFWKPTGNRGALTSRQISIKEFEDKAALNSSMERKEIIFWVWKEKG